MSKHIDMEAALGVALRYLEPELADVLDMRAGNTAGPWRKVYDKRIAELRPTVRILKRLQERVKANGFV